MDCVLPFLPEEIITHIFKRLPVKSLIRFQSVCKPWKTLIKTPSFVKDHLHYSTQRNPSLLIGYDNTYDPVYLYLVDCEMQSLEVVTKPPLLGSFGRARIVGSSNGLLCIADTSEQSHALLLWNPATREVRQVPNTLEDIGDRSRLGFGFSPIINDYKIVRVSLDHWVCRVKVYSLSTGCWKNIQADNLKDVCIGGRGVPANGVMFWMGYRLRGDKIYDSDGEGYYYDRDDVIVSFDMASEVFTVIPWPFSLLLPDVKFKLAVYEDKLAIISHPGIINYDDSSIYFGVMEEGVIGSSEKRWSLCKKYLHDFYPFDLSAGTIWRNQIVCIDPELPRYVTEPEGEGEGQNDNDEVKFGLYIINVATSKRQVISITKQRSYYIKVFNYVESLVPIHNTQIEEP